MNRPFLIAETPNAGPWGYRFLVSHGVSISGATATAFVSKGQGKTYAKGANFIAVGQRVTQRATGRPDASETLVLVGVDTSKIEDQQLQQIIQLLRSWLSDLDVIVQNINWAKEKRFVVPNEKLAQWVLHDKLQQLPRANTIDSPLEDGAANVQTDLPQKRTCIYAAYLVRMATLIIIPACIIILANLITTGRLSLYSISTFIPTSSRQSEEKPESAGHTKSDSKKQNDGDHTSYKDTDQLQSTKEEPTYSKQEENFARKEIDQFFDNVQSKIKKAKSDRCEKSLKSFLQILDQPPHLDKMTQADREHIERLRNYICEELRWISFINDFDRLIRVQNFDQAAHLCLSFTGHRKNELADMKNQFEHALQKALDKCIEDLKFTQARNHFFTPHIVNFVDQDFLQNLLDKLDNAEDRYLYELIIRNEKPKSIDQEIRSIDTYLNSRVAKKPMEKKVRELKQYYLDMNNEKEIYIRINEIHGINQSYNLNVNWTISRANQSPENNKPNAPSNLSNSTKLPYEICHFKAKPTDNVGLNIQMTLLPDKHSPHLPHLPPPKQETYRGEFSHDGTIAKLKEVLSRDQVELKDNKTGASIKVKLEVSGIPEKPELPPWGVSSE